MLTYRYEIQNLSGFDFLNSKQGVYIMKSDRKNIRRFIEGLYFNDTERITATLKELFGIPRCDENEDYLIIALYEACKNGKLEPCSETAVTIGVLIIKANPHREILRAIAHGINDPVVSRDSNWLDDVIFKDTDIPVEARQKFWHSIGRVQEVRQLFAQASYTYAIDERCEPSQVLGDQIAPSSEKCSEATTTHTS